MTAAAYLSRCDGSPDIAEAYGPDAKEPAD